MGDSPERRKGSTETAIVYPNATSGAPHTPAHSPYAGFHALLRELRHHGEPRGERRSVAFPPHACLHCTSVDLLSHYRPFAHEWKPAFSPKAQPSALSCPDDRCLTSRWLSGGVCVGRSSLSDFGFSRFTDNRALHSGTCPTPEGDRSLERK